MTTPKIGLGEKPEIARKPNAGAAVGLFVENTRFQNHSPKTGLQYILPSLYGFRLSCLAVFHAFNAGRP